MDITGSFLNSPSSTCVRFLKISTDDRVQRGRWFVRRLYEATYRRRFYPYWFGARARQAEETSTVEMKDLDINIGHNRQPPGPSASSLRARAKPTLPSRLPRRDHHVTAPRRRRPRPCRSAPLVHHPGVSERNIWPGRPDVSYWRNMARSCEIFPRASVRGALASGDVYLNNYSPTLVYVGTPSAPRLYSIPLPSFFPVVIPCAIFSRRKDGAAGAVIREKIKIPLRETRGGGLPPKGEGVALFCGIPTRLSVRRIATTPDALTHGCLFNIYHMAIGKMSRGGPFCLF